MPPRTRTRTAAAVALAAPAAAAVAVKTITEYTLKSGSGDTEQGLFTDAELDVVKARKVAEIERAAREGRERPELRVVKRVCQFPLDKVGKPQALGSTVEETEV